MCEIEVQGLYDYATHEAFLLYVNTHAGCLLTVVDVLVYPLSYNPSQSTPECLEQEMPILMLE
jgi:hypothetical protein